MDLTPMTNEGLVDMLDECNYPSVVDELARRLAAAEAQLAIARQGLKAIEKYEYVDGWWEIAENTLARMEDTDD